MSPSSGTLRLGVGVRSSIRPPSTRIAPSSTTTVDSIERLVVDGPALLVPAAVVAFTLDCSWKIVMRTVPPSPICGLMRSVMPTSLRSMVWNGLVVAGAGVGELAGDEGHVLADDDLGLLVVQRDQVRRRDDVGVGLRSAARARARPARRCRRSSCSSAMLRPSPGSVRALAGGGLRQRDDARPADGGVGAGRQAVLVAAAARAGPATGSRSRRRCRPTPRRSCSRCRPARGASRAGRSSRAPGGTAARRR